LEREGAEDTLGRWPPAPLVWPASDHRLTHGQPMTKGSESPGCPVFLPRGVLAEIRLCGRSAVLVLPLSPSGVGRSLPVHRLRLPEPS